MTERDDDLDIVLRPWMHQHAPDAPSDLVLRIYGEIETMSERAPTRSWLSRFAAWPVGAWAATIAVVAILAVAGGLFLTNIVRRSYSRRRRPDRRLELGGWPAGGQPLQLPSASDRADRPVLRR